MDYGAGTSEVEVGVLLNERKSAFDHRPRTNARLAVPSAHQFSSALDEIWL
jgi:hypothetical protein